MKLSKVVSSVLLASSMAMFVPSAVMAIGGASGSHIDLEVVGNIGEVIVDPYDIAPLNAVIKNGGYVLKDGEVSIVPKQDGQLSSYYVSDDQVRTRGGIPVVGL